MSTKTRRPSDEYGSFADYSRHDLLLAVMPIPLLGGAAAGMAAPVSLTVGLWIGCLLSLPLLLYAVFVDPPIQG